MAVLAGGVVGRPWEELGAAELMGICPVHLRALLRQRLGLRVEVDGTRTWFVPGSCGRPWRELRGRVPRRPEVDLDALVEEISNRERSPPT